MLSLESPTVLRLIGYENRLDELRKFLTFRKSSATFELQKFKRNPWNARNLTREQYEKRLFELERAVKVCLLFEDERGYWTYAGLREDIAELFKDDQFENLVEYPEPGNLPWAEVPKKTMRPYQEEIVKSLVDARHAGISVGTALGKSFAVLNLVKHYSLKTLVMAPSESIATQLYEEFSRAFGKKYVGMVGGGKKQFGKLITIGIAASLTKIEPGTPGWDHLHDVQVFVVDEAHLAPADTLEKVCHGLVANAPYRFFVSGTLLRNDGADKLLKGITGPTVYTMTVKDGVDQGYLARPMFRMVKVPSTDRYTSNDVQRMGRHHFLYNKQVVQAAAKLANLSVEMMGHQVIILVDEVEQFVHLLPLLKYPCRFAHGGAPGATKDKLSPEYQKSDPHALVQQFNQGEYPILVGTSCINTGTDTQTVETIINLQAGKSPIKFPQSVGRGTRKTPLKPEKDSCYFIDFDVQNVFLDEKNDIVHKHAQERAAIYNSIYPDFEFLELP